MRPRRYCRAYASLPMPPIHARSSFLRHSNSWSQALLLGSLVGLCPSVVWAASSAVGTDTPAPAPVSATNHTASTRAPEWTPHPAKVFALSDSPAVSKKEADKRKAKSALAPEPDTHDAHLAAVDQFAIAASAWSKDKAEAGAPTAGQPVSGPSTATNILAGQASTPVPLEPSSGRVRLPNGASVMAPPSASPGLLPPIPAALLGSLPPNPAEALPSGRATSRPSLGSTPSRASSAIDNGEKTPGGTASLGPTLPYDGTRLVGMLKIEAQRMGLASAPNMAVAFVVEGTPESQRLSTATHMYVGTPRAPVAGPYDYGLSTLFLPDSAPLGGRGASCMIILHPDDGARLWSRFIAPLAQVSHPDSGAAFLVGHAMAHCLEAQSRMGLDAKMTWGPDQTPLLLGMDIWPAAAWVAYGSPMNKDAYWANPALLNKNPAQQQFSERGADSLGAAWMFKLGGDAQAMKALEANAAALAAGQAHATGPVWPILKGQEDAFRSAQRLPELWGMAQAVRNQVGVSTTAQETADNGAPPDQTGDVRHWKVTASGLIPVDDKGNIIPGAKPAGAPINFNQLTPFGGGTFGGGTFGGGTFGPGRP